ncbi:YcjF family protein [Rhodalgimonas zhirmunskyi]|uniref:YcjF family protein n=1 Tax=Rhodalgimonas zhirmunskyi TaxID=2964767 RepID=A0AAJ1U659_9RHOB|nr:TIGR01620 family protein [Rhodoalgimonas zhirmunskyi]MDQ2093734.1 YcjF family protein [Rhodoalgimonas zhirmunskyi]
MTKGPILIDLSDDPAPNPAEAPPVPDHLPGQIPEPRAMQQAAALVTARPSRLARWFWGLLGALLSTLITIAAWEFATSLIASNPLLGWFVTALFAGLLLTLLIIALRELAAFARLKRIDTLHHEAATSLAQDDIKAARAVTAKLDRLYADRPALRLARETLKTRTDEQFDAATILSLAESELLGPLDKQATAHVEAAARQVATVTAIVPLALADVFAALTANIRMIRRIAEVYGGRSGTLGSLRLVRAVLTHLVATGAVAVGDDMIGSLAGGGLLSKLSRRFGEGVVNGALTARVGVAAIEVCRPLPFGKGRRPSVSALVGRALTGLFGSGKEKPASD